MVKIRLRRMGSTHKPFYRVVVSDSRRTPTSSAIEELGYYNPRSEPAVVSLDRERIEHWVSKGAQLSDSVKKLLKRPAAAAPETAAQAAPEAKAEAKAETAAQAAPEAPPAEASSEAPAETEAASA
jgi:small subunit ribosomal protein S16